MTAERVGVYFDWWAGPMPSRLPKPLLGIDPRLERFTFVSQVVEEPHGLVRWQVDCEGAETTDCS